MDQPPFSDHALMANVNIRDATEMLADIKKTLAASRETITETHAVLAKADELLARR